MSASSRGSRAGSRTVDQPAYSRRFPLTDMPVWLMAALVAVGIPRTLLADLDVDHRTVDCSTTHLP